MTVSPTTKTTTANARTRVLSKPKAIDYRLFILLPKMASTSSDCSVEDVAKAAKFAFESSQLLPPDARSLALERIAERLEANKVPILAANSEDMQVQSLSSLVRCALVDLSQRLLKSRLMREGCPMQC